MISRTLLVAALGFTLAAGTVADASAKLAAPTATKAVATKTLPTKTLQTKTAATKTTKVINGRHVRMIAGKHHRFLVSHRGIKRVTVAKITVGKRLVVSHVAKRVIHKHA